MKIAIDNYNIEYNISGNGNKNVIILQGWGTTLNLYDSIVKCFNDEYRVIQFDFPGFGKSDEPSCGWTVDDYTDFFIKFVNKLNIKNATLIGHSFGGRVIIKLANRSNIDFIINNIVLIDSAGIKPKKTAAQKMRIRNYKILKKILFFKPIHFIFAEAIDGWANKQGSEDYRNASPIMKQCLVKAVNEDLTDLLPGVKPETLLIWGDKDTATPISDAKIMEKMLPDAGLAVISGTGHFSFVESPIVFRNIIKSYFKMEKDNAY